MTSEKRPSCPKCGKTMTKAGKTPGGKTRWACRTMRRGEALWCYNTTDSTAKGIRKQDGSQQKRTGKTPIFRRVLEPVQRYIITAAQNATPVHELFLKSLERAANHLTAELLVVPIRYKNPTSRWSESQANAETWSPKVTPYLWNQRRALNKNLILLGDIKTQPTAVNPLDGFDALSHAASGIIAHTKLQLKCIPTPQNRMAKILTTTGACTLPNYTDSKAGKLGEFHHTLGAALVEIQGSKFHLRQLNAHKVTGAFTDLDRFYQPGGWAPAPPAAALVMGDTHVDFIDPAVYEATFGKFGIIDVLKPQTLVYHDLLDSYSVNPHHRGNPFNAVAKRMTGKDDARAEVRRAIDFVRRHGAKDRNALVIASNHDDMLRRWIVSNDWKTDPTNAEFYLETALAMVRGTQMTDSGTVYPSPFTYWLERAHIPGVDCVNTSRVISGIEVGMHGDQGPSGSPGSARNLRRIGIKSVIGHSHSPAIEEGCYQVGTSTRLKLEYNSGPGAWLNTHCVIHADGKRQLIHIIDGAWRLV